MLIKIAKDLGIQNTKQMKKSGLIEAILLAEGY